MTGGAPPPPLQAAVTHSFFHFLQAALMKYISRDANVVQFVGAVVQSHERLMLVAEYLEVGRGWQGSVGWGEVAPTSGAASRAHQEARGSLPAPAPPPRAQGGDLRNALTADRAGELSWWRRGKGVALDTGAGAK